MKMGIRGTHRFLQEGGEEQHPLLDQAMMTGDMKSSENDASQSAANVVHETTTATTGDEINQADSVGTEEVDSISGYKSDESVPVEAEHRPDSDGQNDTGSNVGVGNDNPETDHATVNEEYADQVQNKEVPDQESGERPQVQSSDHEDKTMVKDEAEDHITNEDVNLYPNDQSDANIQGVLGMKEEENFMESEKFVTGIDIDVDNGNAAQNPPNAEQQDEAPFAKDQQSNLLDEITKQANPEQDNDASDGVEPEDVETENDSGVDGLDGSEGDNDEEVMDGILQDMINQVLPDDDGVLKMIQEHLDDDESDDDDDGTVLQDESFGEFYDPKTAKEQESYENLFSDSGEDYTKVPSIDAKVLDGGMEFDDFSSNDDGTFGPMLMAILIATVALAFLLKRNSPVSAKSTNSKRGNYQRIPHHNK